jgi:hypothetical protein
VHGPDTDDHELAALRDAFPGYRFRRRFVRGVLCYQAESRTAEPRPAEPRPAEPRLPVGLQLVGRYGADRRLLEIAAAVMAIS